MLRRVLSLLFVSGVLALPACNPSENPTSPTPKTNQPTSRPATPPTSSESDPNPTPTPPPETSTDPVSKAAEPLPEAPKLDPKNELKPLNPENTLLLELAVDPKNPDKKKPVRVLVVSEVCLREGPLEVLLCRKNTKEHEAILRADLDGRFIHAALIAAGGVPGSPVQFVNPKTGEEQYKPATGTQIDVALHYRNDGKLHTHPAQEWIVDLQTKKPMAHQWVFAGSRFMPHPDRPEDPPYYCANNGEFIAISNFIDSMLDVPVEVTGDNEGLLFGADTKKIPPLYSKVWVILEPKPKSPMEEGKK
jgi:hypothetical protein